MLLEIVSSSISGLISRVICHPLDTIKSRQQSGKYLQRNILEVITHTYKHGGIRSFYKGIGAVIVGGVPGISIYLTSYEITKRNLLEYNNTLKTSPFIIYFSSGMIAEALCCLLFVPVDVVKERLQVQNKNTNIKYNGSYDAFVKIIKHEGINGLYKGYKATLLSYGPFSALYFLFYEEMKKNCITLNNTKDVTFTQSLLCSAVAGAGASYITNPLDLVKLRMQLERGNSFTDQNASKKIYKTMWQSIRLVMKEDGGIRGLFRGAFARVVFHCPNTAITMALFEYINSKFRLNK